MFHTNVFSQDISHFDTSSVERMTSMFAYNYAFDQHLNDWDVSQVTRMDNMFYSAVFNQPLDQWDTSSLVYAG